MQVRSLISRAVTLATAAALVAPTLVAQDAHVPSASFIQATGQYHTGRWFTLAGFALATGVVLALQRNRRRRRR